MKHPSTISVQDFNYHLPQERIATYPLKQRDESRLLIYQNNVIREDRFKHLDQFLPENSMLVFNTTKVVQARLKFTSETGKAIEIFCLEPARTHKDLGAAMAAKRTARWTCLVGNLKQWKQEELVLEKDKVVLKAKILGYNQGSQVVSFTWKPSTLSFAQILQELGVMPIPPYLKRESEDVDQERYQTIYAKTFGSVAAPTAGLHFTDKVLKNLRARSIDITGVTLHVSAGTFMPVKSSTMKEHVMHAEWIEVKDDAIRELLARPPHQIIAVGTTSLRTLETIYWMGVKALRNPAAELKDLEVEQWDAYDLEPAPREESLTALLAWMQAHELRKIICRTSILIAPPYDLKMAAGIITNFHQPQSTLLLLIGAIVGDRWKDIYSYALVNNFRFLSYGDSSLLLK